MVAAARVVEGLHRRGADRRCEFDAGALPPSTAPAQAQPGLGDGPLEWLPADPDVLVFSRGDAFVCVVNLSDGAVSLPTHTEIILASGPLHEGLLPADTAVWLRTAS